MNMRMLELNDVKLAHAIHNRNWNRPYYFFGYYCHRGESFRENDICRCVTDDKHLALRQNAAIEWE